MHKSLKYWARSNTESLPANSANLVSKDSEHEGRPPPQQKSRFELPGIPSGNLCFDKDGFQDAPTSLTELQLSNCPHADNTPNITICPDQKYSASLPNEVHVSQTSLPPIKHCQPRKNEEKKLSKARERVKIASHKREGIFSSIPLLRRKEHEKDLRRVADSCDQTSRQFNDTAVSQSHKQEVPPSVPRLPHNTDRESFEQGSKSAPAPPSYRKPVPDPSKPDYHPNKPCHIEDHQPTVVGYREALTRCLKHAKQSSDDKSIAGAVYDLFELVHQHVANFYVCGPAPIPPESAEILTLPRFAFRGWHSLPKLLIKSPYQDVIITRSLTKMIVQHISLNDGSDFSLLPNEFTDLPRGMKHSNSNEKPLFEQEFLALWRLASSHLRPNISEDPNYIQDRESTIRQLCKDFTLAFKPWENLEQSPEQRNENLRDLLLRAAEVGIMLFSQTSLFHFEWRPPPYADEHIEVVVSPRLLKIQDENAQLLKPAPMLVDPRVELLYPHNDISHNSIDSGTNALRRDREQETTYYGTHVQETHILEEKQVLLMRVDSTLPEATMARDEDLHLSSNFSGCQPDLQSVPHFRPSISRTNSRSESFDKSAPEVVIPTRGSSKNQVGAEVCNELWHKVELDIAPKVPEKDFERHHPPLKHDHVSGFTHALEGGAHHAELPDVSDGAYYGSLRH